MECGCGGLKEIGIREGGQRRPIALLANSIQSYMGEIIQSLAKNNMNRPEKQQRWIRPAGDFLKINFDATFRRETGDVGWGFIIRDSEGDAVLAGSGRIGHHLLDAFQAEVIACLQRSPSSY